MSSPKVIVPLNNYVMLYSNFGGENCGLSPVLEDHGILSSTGTCSPDCTVPCNNMQNLLNQMAAFFVAETGSGDCRNNND